MNRFVLSNASCNYYWAEGFQGQTFPQTSYHIFMIHFLGGQCWAEHQGVWHSAGETRHLRPGHQLSYSASGWGASASGSVPSSWPCHDGVLCGWVQGCLPKLGQSCSSNCPMELSRDNGLYKGFIFALSISFFSVSIYESLGIHLSPYT